MDPKCVVNDIACQHIRMRRRGHTLSPWGSIQEARTTGHWSKLEIAVKSVKGHNTLDLRAEKDYGKENEDRRLEEC